MSLKKVILFSLMLLIPFIFLVLLEAGLRWMDFGQDYELFIKSGNNLKVNPDAARKYFSRSDIFTPELIEQTFPGIKAPNTVRIFCLGESSTAGYPYEENINFPYFVRVRLQTLYPGKNFEVINLGISAINSFAVLDLIPQVISAQPDIVLIYLGHNEFYGAFGTASSEFASISRPAVRIILWLRELRIYQGLQKIISALMFRESADKSGNLMEVMVAEKSIPFGGKAYVITHENFRLNLTEILQELTDHKIITIVGTQLSNLADLPPLHYLAGTGSDTSSAFRHYQQGRILYDEGKYEEARIEFSLARDLDELRFRAASELNTVIKSVGHEMHIPVADVEEEFSAATASGIPGNDLFLEHVHPNPRGYDLIAKSFVDRIINSESSILPDSLTRIPADTVDYQQLSGFTLLDRYIGELKIIFLVSRFPFSGKFQFTLPEADTPEIERLALLHNRKEMLWDEVHYKLGDFFLQQKQFDRAAAEYRAVMLVYPNLPPPYYKLAHISELNDDWPKAEGLYKKALELFPNGHFLYGKLGLVLISEKKYSQAVQILKSLVEKEVNQPQLSAQETIEARFLLAAALAQNKQIDQAENLLQAILQQVPEHRAARDLLRQIRSYKSEKALVK